jgi:hypothetical protein
MWLQINSFAERATWLNLVIHISFLFFFLTKTEGKAKRFYAQVKGGNNEQGK